jgi:hypothetical protein
VKEISLNFKRLFLVSLFFLVPGIGFSAQYDFTEVEAEWRTKATSAYTSVMATHGDGSIVHYYFLINFDPSDNCASDFGFSAIEGGEFREMLETNLIEKGFFKLFVDEKLIYDDEVLSISYENGNQLGHMVTEKMLEKIKGGQILKIKLSNIAEYLFQLKDAGNSIDEAHNQCKK